MAVCIFVWSAGHEAESEADLLGEAALAAKELAPPVMNGDSGFGFDGIVRGDVRIVAWLAVEDYEASEAL